jgi:SAM-dependent methyltransferase
MNYDYHTTTWDERDSLMNTENYKWIKIKPTDFTQLFHEEDRAKPIVWDEKTKDYYELNYCPIFDTIRQIDLNPEIDYKDTAYYTYWVKSKGEDYVEVRIRLLKDLLASMKNGFNKDDGRYKGICVERTGEKFDGSHRCLVAHYLGIPEVEVKEYAFNWRDVSWDWIERKTKAREKGIGPNYYLLDYGKFKNLEQKVSYVYEENAMPRWEILKEHIEGKVLDLGCNEGFMSIQSALKGCKVKGVDYKFIDGAWFNKLVFEKINEKDLDIEFETADLNTYEISEEYDTCLLLNVIYHLKDKEHLLKQLKKCKKVIMQGNLRKLPYHDRYYGITADDMVEMLSKDFDTKVIEWRDKPIVIGYAKTN